MQTLFQVAVKDRKVPIRLIAAEKLYEIDPIRAAEPLARLLNPRLIGNKSIHYDQAVNIANKIRSIYFSQTDRNTRKLIKTLVRHGTFTFQERIGGSMPFEHVDYIETKTLHFDLPPLNEEINLETESEDERPNAETG